MEKRELRAKTKEAYEKILKRYEELEIKDARGTYKKIRESGIGLSYTKMIMSAFKWETKEAEYGKIIKEIMEEMKKTTKPYENKFKKVKWEEIESPTGDTVNDLIKGIYTMFSPRRVMDYANMVYIEREEEIKSKEENYYMKGGEYVFQNYKTVGKYGVQRFKVSEELKGLIERYVKRNEIKAGDALIKNKKGSKRFSRDALMERIKRIFGTSVNGLKHSYITYLYRNMDNLFDIEETSAKMAHSVVTHLQYLDKENR